MSHTHKSHLLDDRQHSSHDTQNSSDVGVLCGGSSRKQQKLGDM